MIPTIDQLYARNKQLHMAVKTGIYTLDRDMYLSTLELCDFLLKKCWRNKQIVSMVKEIKQLNDGYYRDSLLKQGYDRPKANKILWREKRMKHAEENRDRHTPGNIRWRQKGLPKQTINSEVSNSAY